MARNFVIEQAKRDNLKARIAISAPSGAGKTSQALWLAEALRDEGDILLIDTERGSAKLYSKLPGTDGDGTVFKHIDFQPPYAPLELAEALDQFGGAFDVIIIDSLSHFWNGPGGILDIVNRSSNSVQGWRNATPMQDRMISSILNAPCHVICNTRAKTDTQLEKDSKGKLQVRTFGMKAVQREDVIYEFTVVLEIDKESHLTSVAKTRMRGISGHTFQTPTDIRQLGTTMKEWLNVDNEEAMEAAASMEKAAAELLDNAVAAVDTLTEEEATSDRISEDQLKELSGVFSQLPKGPERDGAKLAFQNIYANPKNISAGNFDNALKEAEGLVKASVAA